MANNSSVNYVRINSSDENGVSLCIPFMFNNITAARVWECMKNTGLGRIERIDIIPVKDKNGRAGKRAFVHFQKYGWNMNSEEAVMALDAISSGKQIKIEYDTPWYWLVGALSSKRLTRDERMERAEEAKRRKEQKKVKISIGDWYTPPKQRKGGKNAKETGKDKHSDAVYGSRTSAPNYGRKQRINVSGLAKDNAEFQKACKIAEKNGVKKPADDSSREVKKAFIETMKLMDETK